MTKEECKKKVLRLSEIVEEAKILIIEIEAFTKDSKYSQFDDIRISATKIASFPTLGTRLMNACKVNGNFDTLGELLRHSPTEVAGYRNVGKKVIEVAQKIIWDEYGVEWK